MSAPPKFGDRVSCLQKLRRTYEVSRRNSRLDFDGPYNKVWERVALAPRIGILIGYRTLMDVRVYDHGRGRPGTRVQFDVLRRQRAALVVFNGSENPVYVPTDAMVLA